MSYDRLAPRFSPKRDQAALSREDIEKLDRLVRARGGGALAKLWNTSIIVVWRLASGSTCRKEVAERIGKLVREQ